VLNLAAAAMLLSVAFAGFGANAETLGLRGPHRRGALIGIAAASALVAPLFIALAHPATADLVADERVAGLDRGELAFRVLVRIPLATALLEEVAFRAVLPALWRPAGRKLEVLVPSLAFGLWHIVPALDALEANDPAAGWNTMVLAVGASVLVTAAAGALLIWFKGRMKTLAAPLAFHASLNSLATVAAWLAIGRV
jgi:membrane protease YdiL (CAAX protease family)